MLGRLRREQLVAELREQLRRRGGAVVRGQLDGLTSRERAPLGRNAGELSDAYRAGVLTGMLYGRLLDERGGLDRELVLSAGIYGASVAQGAALGHLEQGSAAALLKEHTAACIRVAWKGAQLAADDELTFFRWLADELAVPLGDASLAAYARMRERRLERLARDRVT